MADTVIDGLDVFHGKAFGEAQGHEQLRGPTVHGVDVGKVDHGRLVAQVLEGGVGEVKMYAFEQQVGGDKREAICGVTDGGCVVANAEDGCVVAGRNAVRQSVDESELAQRGDFGAGGEGIHVKRKTETDERSSSNILLRKIPLYTVCLLLR